MTQYTDLNYLENQYLDDEYLTTTRQGGDGLQFEVIIEKQTSLGAQFQSIINEALSHLALQFETHMTKETSFGVQFQVEILSPVAMPIELLIQITDKLQSLSAEFELFISPSLSLAAEFSITVENALKASATEFLAVILEPNTLGVEFSVGIGKESSMGLQFTITMMHIWNGYLVSDYLSYDYLGKSMLVLMPIDFLAQIVNKQYALSVQFQVAVNKQTTLATQFEAIIADTLRATGVQFNSVVATALAAQFRIVLYNTTNLRILMDFPSRGIAPNNWTASSTAAGDFGIANVNDDLVEHVYRSNTSALNVVLTCDTGLPQGVYLDTLALMNHNLTTSAGVELIGSNDPGFSPIGFSTQLIITERNYIYVSPDLPLEGFRYWKLVITDNTNPDNFIEIGTIIFGESIIFQGECFKNPIKYKKTHYYDSIMTEGFTTAQNDRGIKAKLGLDFQALNFSGGNYSNIQDIFEYARTNLKCLWIPTPNYPTRYSVFGKLLDIPDETHTDNGENADYVDFSIEIDEAK